MTEACKYGTIKELLVAARDIDKNSSSLSLRDGFYKEVRTPLDRPESHLAVRIYSSIPPLYLLEERGRYFCLGRVKELIERYPNLGRQQTNNEEKLKRLDLLPITHEEAIEKAIRYDTKKTEITRKQSA